MTAGPITHAGAIDRQTAGLGDARSRIGRVLKLYPRRGAAAQYALCLFCLAIGAVGAVALFAVDDDPVTAAAAALFAALAAAGLVVASGRRLLLLGERGFALAVKRKVEVCLFADVREVGHEVQVSPFRPNSAHWLRIDVWRADGSRVSIPGADLHGTPDFLAELRARCPDARFAAVTYSGPT
jgi:hypothetical protein